MHRRGPAGFGRALLLVTLGLSACTSSKGAAPDPSTEVSPGSLVAVERVRDPDLTPVLAFVAGAQHSVDCEVYLLTETIAKVALGDQVKRHQRVRLILEPSVNTDTAWVAQEGIQLLRPPYGMRLDHAKACVRDWGTTDAAVLVSTANWTYSAAHHNLDYALVIPVSDPAAASLGATIEADMEGRPAPAPATGAVVSPTNSREALAALLRAPGVTAAVIIEEELRDSGMKAVLAQITAAGVKVFLASPDAALAPAGVTRCKVDFSTSYPHAKVIVTFSGSRPNGMFLGSENLSAVSLDSNRELGISEPRFAVATAKAIHHDLPAACWPH